jgi:hypothetical protein
MRREIKISPENTLAFYPELGQEGTHTQQIIDVEEYISTQCLQNLTEAASLESGRSF